MVLAGFGIGWWMSWTPRLLMRLEGPWWTRLGVMLLPWLGLGLWWRFRHRFWRPDEMELLINREALSIAFYVMLFGLLALNQLQAAGWVPVFLWTNDRLFLALAILMSAGLLWTKRRFH